MKDIILEPSYVLFVKALQDVVKDNLLEDMFDEIGLDKEGIYVVNPLMGHDLSPLSFSCIWYTESTSVNIDYKLEVLLKRSTQIRDYLAVTIRTMAVEDYGDTKDHPDPIISEEITYEVDVLLDGSITNVFVEDEMNATTPIYAILEAGKLLLVDKVTKEDEEIL